MKKFDNTPFLIDSSEFAWCTNGRGQKIGVSELSTMNRRIVRLWNDSIDIGFEVRSVRTGVCKLFTFDSERREEGEVVSVVYASIDGTTKIELLNT